MKRVCPVRAESVALLAMLSPTTHPGPHSTMGRLAEGFVEAGSDPVQLTIIEEETVKGLLRMLVAAASSQQAIVLIRHVEAAAPLIFIIGLVLRLRRRFFVLQVATPVSSAHLDTNRRRGNMFHMVSRAVITSCHPFIFSIPHLILQYAPERGRMARIGASKTILISHPTDAGQARTAISDPQTIRAVGIAGSANSPGFDRFIRGLGAYRTVDSSRTLEVVIIGHDEALQAERELIDALELSHSVTFTGALFGTHLHDVLATATFGIGTLAGHRVGLTTASPLKHRTYLAHGIPFVTSIADPGLPADAAWILQVPADDTPLDMQNVLNWVTSLPREESRQEMKRWSDENLSAQSIATRIVTEIRNYKE